MVDGEPACSHFYFKLPEASIKLADKLGVQHIPTCQSESFLEIAVAAAILDRVIPGHDIKIIDGPCPTTKGEKK